MKVKFYLQTEGMKLNRPIFKILKLRTDENFDIWQMESFDELISMNVDICKLNDKDIEMVIEVFNKGKGYMRIFKGNIMKSGLHTVEISKNFNSAADAADDVFDGLIKLEKAIYMRKSKEVANWQVKLMKEKLKELKKKYFNLKHESFILNLIIPIPSYPLKLRTREGGGGGVKNIIEIEDLCMKDIEESQEDKKIKRKYPELFKNEDSRISNGDLRVLKGILLQRSEGIPVDASNLLWTHREYLSRRFPSGIIRFVESVQWWLTESDPTEIDEALRVIENWQFKNCKEEEKMEIAVILMVEMCKLNGLKDSKIWIKLFKKLIEKKEKFSKKFQTVLILFLTTTRTRTTTTTTTTTTCSHLNFHLEGMKELKEFLKEILFIKGEIEEVSELYWRLKTDENGAELFEEYKKKISSDHLIELGNQEKLFESIELVLTSAQRIKGPRSIKLEYIKKSLDDIDTGIPSATQHHPLIPGLLQANGRVAAIVSDRSNLFKSTAFTVLLVFLRSSQGGKQLSLPIIFKKGDDLRRDAACLRIFRAIWDIWREEGGLELFPKELLYGVTSLSSDFGLVEYIESIPLSRIINVGEEDTGVSSEWALTKYLNEKDTGRSSNNFLTSCVGFSLLTYLLGIGDRHLDNLLLTPEGRLLHIDFSFVFGNDPKPFPPPIKITREIIRGFESGDQGNPASFEKWNEFKGLCFTALTLLRRKSPLILALIDSEYRFQSSYQQFVRDRLGVMVSQAEAVQRLDKLMEESRVAMFPVVMETIHKWVQYWKS